MVYIPRGQKHSVLALTELKLIEVGIGSEITSEDVEIFEYSWELK